MVNHVSKMLLQVADYMAIPHDKKCDEHVQNLKRAALGSRYNNMALIKEYKRSLNGPIRRKLMESETPPVDLQERYDRSIAIDWH